MKTQIKIKSLDQLTLQLYLKFLKNIFLKIRLKNFTMQNFPLKKKKISLLKSPHVNKKAIEQFEFKVYKALVTIRGIKNLPIFKYLILNKPKNLKFIIKTL